MLLVVLGNWIYLKTNGGQKYFKKNLTCPREFLSKKFGNIRAISVRESCSKSLKRLKIEQGRLNKEVRSEF
jgi:hypothetical protein